MRRFAFAALFAVMLATAAYAQDSWKFADEDEAAPTWADDIKTQAPGLAMFAGFATLALIGFFRKSEPLKWVTMGVAVVYLGFTRNQLISVVNIFALTTWNLPVFRHNLVWYFFAIFTFKLLRLTFRAPEIFRREFRSPASQRRRRLRCRQR